MFNSDVLSWRWASDIASVIQDVTSTWKQSCFWFGLLLKYHLHYIWLQVFNYVAYWIEQDQWFILKIMTVMVKIDRLMCRWRRELIMRINDTKWSIDTYQLDWLWQSCALFRFVITNLQLGMDVIGSVLQTNSVFGLTVYRFLLVCHSLVCTFLLHQFLDSIHML